MVEQLFFPLLELNGYPVSPPMTPLREQQLKSWDLRHFTWIEISKSAIVKCSIGYIWWLKKHVYIVYIYIVS